MEIKPQKNYKKPAFALGLASLMAVSGTLTGCTDGAENSSDTKGGSSEVSHGGAVAISTDSTTTLEYDGGLELVGEVEFDGVPVIPDPDETATAGDVYIPEETEILELDGDVVCPPDDDNE